MAKIKRPSAIKRRRRRTDAEMGAISDAIHEVLAADHPQSVRHVFYRLIAEHGLDHVAYMAS